jgi:protein arginine kinase activator
MKCDQCEQEATVHETRKVNGKMVERHLCQKCARDKGIDAQPQISVPELLQKYLQHAAEVAKTGAAAGTLAAPAQAGKATSCPACGTGYLEFRQSGLLGCPDCYRAFEQQLAPLLERAHEGGSHHIGKLPKRALTGARQAAAPRDLESLLGGAQERAGRIKTLRKQLEEAIAAEQYERAAKIRDELRRMQELEGGAPEAEGPLTL